MTIFIWLVLAIVGGVILSACYAGKPPFVATLPAVLRTDLLFGYYGSIQGQITETKDHVNVFFAARWYGPVEQVLQMQEADAAGLKLILDLGEQDSQSIRARFTLLDSVGLLRKIVMIYPDDEPKNEVVFRERVKLVRSILAEFNLSTPIGVIYSVNNYIATDAPDWVGFDNYDADVFENGDFAKFLQAIPADKGIILPIGGADHWRQLPMRYLIETENNPRIKWFAPFIWFDQADPQNGAGAGIRSNGLAIYYNEAGKIATGK